jgi:hypothetical protein
VHSGLFVVSVCATSHQDFGFASAGEDGGGFGRSGVPVSIANFHEPSG